MHQKLFDSASELPSSPFPDFTIGTPQNESLPNSVINVMSKKESERIQDAEDRQDFEKKESIVIHEGKRKHYYMTPQKALSFTAEFDCFVNVSADCTQRDDFLAFASNLLSSGFKFTRKEKAPEGLKIWINESPKAQLAVNLARSRIQSKEWANGRGDYYGTPQYFEKKAVELKGEFPEAKLGLTIIKGEDLIKEGFRLMHAVGRASVYEPTFVNLSYEGDPENKDSWIAFVGKGVCFDSGGLDIKPAASMLTMFLDKHGACSVFSAFKSIVAEKLKVNVTCSMGWVENSIGEKAYRPSDIIQSRKGLTVEIGNTDAEGRLVLADCMNWTQERYQCRTLVELSTLTGSVIFALGHRFAGVFSNSKQLVAELRHSGEQVDEEVWELPVTDYHRDLIKSKAADITNSSGKTESGSSQAAAFLENFVEKGVDWAHIDIAGAAKTGNGFGSRLLLQFARNSC